MPEFMIFPTFSISFQPNQSQYSDTHQSHSIQPETSSKTHLKQESRVFPTQHSTNLRLGLILPSKKRVIHESYPSIQNPLKSLHNNQGLGSYLPISFKSRVRRNFPQPSPRKKNHFTRIKPTTFTFLAQSPFLVKQ